MRHPERRLLVSVDMERYSRRSNLQQYEAQENFHTLLHAAATEVGLDRVAWTTQQAGDGELAILPRDVPESRVIGRFVPELNRRLRAFNSSRTAPAQIRLRVAVHQGLVHLDGANGFPGHAVVHVCRLCDATPVRQALAAFPDAGVALVVSTEMYRDVVCEYPEEMRPERFRRIEVEHPAKEFREPAWLYVVDEDMSSWPPPQEPSSPTGGPPPPRPDTGSGTAGKDTGSGTAGSGIRTGDIWVQGQNAIGPNATAIGSVGRDAVFGGDGGGR
ncbi:hypothetical protein [Micromonospora antibiotica]|uniref:Guanylate cyclase domain-containing protein n=1 Tax=Micromonospora antibiotica TaxID=2807623 RepID=A0ABS3VGA8_9ACTN|nr:hypothetical protein [Micromonospora antibiotica]MBO4164668.1 hypothetical protein [Micromonospora antibiotica]